MTATLDLGWANAASLTDLCELTARWLEGAIPDQPGYRGGPAAETAVLIPALAALNRAGYLTAGSQPAYDGDGYDGAWWQQRGAVEGFTDQPALLAQIVAGCRRAGLTVVVNQATRWRCRYDTAVGVSRRHDGDGWDETCGFGTTRSRRDLAGCYDSIPGPALRALQAAWQVTVVDPWWGREDTLWTALAGCLDLPEGTTP